MRSKEIGAPRADQLVIIVPGDIEKYARRVGKEGIIHVTYGRKDNDYVAIALYRVVDNPKGFELIEHYRYRSPARSRSSSCVFDL